MSTFAFVKDVVKKGDVVLLPDYLENLDQSTLDLLEEDADFKVTNVRWSAMLANSPYKVFRLKQKQNKK